MKRYLLPKVNTESIPRNILEGIQDRQKREIEEIIHGNGEISDITQKVQNKTTTYTFVMNFYSNVENPEGFRLVQVIKLAETFPQYFFPRFYTHFERILQSPLTFKEKYSRLKKIRDDFDHGRDFWGSDTKLDINKYARIVTLSENFDERFTLAQKIDRLSGGLQAQEIWWIFRGRGVTIERLGLAIAKMEKYQQDRMHIKLADSIPDNFDDIIEQRRKLFEGGMNNILSKEQIDAICRSFRIDIKYLEINIQKYLNSDKRPKDESYRSFLVHDLIQYSNQRDSHHFDPTDKYFGEEIPF